MKDLTLRIESGSGFSERRLSVANLVIAGWTGRDKAAMEHHIAELEAIGVKRPPRTPMYYRGAATRLTVASEIEVLGANTSGEIEFILLAWDGALYVGVGSDHTDRSLETVGVSLSKQVCDKPIAATVWPFSDVEAHWEQLILRSHAVIDGTRQLYQEGSVTTMLAPQDLVKGYSDGGRLADGTVMFGGTLAARGGIRPADRFEGEIEDPILKRRITFAYDVKSLPDLG
jgi:hypothetical protein